jgi:hypothetical protein
VIVSKTYEHAPTETVDAGGTSFAHRRLGADTGVPVIFLQRLPIGGWPSDPRARSAAPLLENQQRRSRHRSPTRRAHAILRPTTNTTPPI